MKVLAADLVIEINRNEAVKNEHSVSYSLSWILITRMLAYQGKIVSVQATFIVYQKLFCLKKIYKMMIKNEKILIAFDYIFLQSPQMLCYCQVIYFARDNLSIKQVACLV